MAGSRFLRLCLVLLAAGRVVSTMVEGESVVSTTSKRNLGSRIVGGTKTDPKRHPYFTYMEITFQSGWWGTYSKFCGGTLIAKDVVLTAAHCLTSESSVDEVLTIQAYVNSTTTYYNQYEYSRVASQFLVHASYDASAYANDIALVFLDEPVEKVTLAKITKNGSAPVVGKAVTAIGLGLLQRPDEVDATYLMQVSMKTLRGSDCSNLYGASYFRNLNQICAGSTKNTCDGDYGGPLLLKGTTASKDLVAGITSHGYSEGCGQKPTVYTRVSKYVRWIETGVCDYSDYPTTACP